LQLTSVNVTLSFFDHCINERQHRLAAAFTKFKEKGMRVHIVFLSAVFLTSAGAQTKSSAAAEPAVSPSPGVLAIQADRSGTLYLDGAKTGKIEALQILSVNVAAGQHFAEFRDDDGRKLWGKIVSVPAGVQVAEKIDVPNGTPPLPSASAATATASAAQAAQRSPGGGEDYLNMNDEPSFIEQSVEGYLNRNGLHAQVVSGNSGKTHYVQLGFRGNNGQPNVMVRLSALDQGSNSLGRWRNLLLTLGTNIKLAKSDGLYTTLDEANKTSHCAWFVDTDNELMCRAWPTLPNSQYSVPTDQILTLVRFILGDWARIYPQITGFRTE
jgi:hypothetical protein